MIDDGRGDALGVDSRFLSPPPPPLGALLRQFSRPRRRRFIRATDDAHRIVGRRRLLALALTLTLVLLLSRQRLGGHRRRQLGKVPSIQKRPSRA